MSEPLPKATSTACINLVKQDPRWHQHRYYTQGYAHAYTQCSKQQALPLKSKRHSQGFNSWLQKKYRGWVCSLTTEQYGD